MAYRARWAVVVLAVGFAGIQFIRPAETNPPVNPAHTLLAKTPPEIRAILDRSCRDCHSNETRWPLYSKVAPTSWFVASHVHEGRDRFNYSEWTSYVSDDQDKFLGSMCSLTKKGRMPLPSYLLIHRESVLSPSDITAICTWSEKMRDTLQ